LLKLHTYGLLNNSFQPTSQIRVVRTYWRQRAEHVRAAASSIQRMQKALTQMNVQLANVISDLSGLTGQLIVRAIVGGERDPQKLAELRDRRIHASPEEVAKSLEGNWRPELLFLVKQEVDTYDTYQKRIAECAEQLQQQLASFASVAPAAAAPVTSLPGDDQPKKARAKHKKLAKNAPRFNLEQELQRVAGVDLTRIDGIDVMVAQTIIAEVGLDMGRWKTETNFASWLGLCPDNRITGNKVVGRGTRHVVNRAATAPRMAANALLRSQTYLAPSTVVCAPNWEPRRPLLPWPTGSPDSSIGC
jgi:hypothetical protein